MDIPERKAFDKRSFDDLVYVHIGAIPEEQERRWRRGELLGKVPGIKSDEGVNEPWEFGGRL